MNEKILGKETVSNSNNVPMVSDPFPGSQPYSRVSTSMPPHTWTHKRTHIHIFLWISPPQASRIPKKAATFGKRSNSMRRNPKAAVTIQGWLWKQASTGVKQWNKRWFVLTDRCLFYYKDEKEEGVLGSLPLLSFQIGEVQPSDNINRKFAFKVWYEEEEERDTKDRVAFCLQAEHAGTRSYYFSSESLGEQQEWIRAMTEAAQVHTQPLQRPSERTMVLQSPSISEPYHLRDNTRLLEGGPLESVTHEVNGVDASEKKALASSSMASKHEQRVEERDGGERGVQVGNPPQHPSGWGNSASPTRPPDRGARMVQEKPHQQENVVLRRGFIPRTAPERQAQRKSSMTQLQQWVNQRRLNPQEDIQSPSRGHTVNRSVSADHYGVYGREGGAVYGPYAQEFPLYPAGIRPESICSVSGGFERAPPYWAEEKRRSLRDGLLFAPHHWTPGPSPGPAFSTGPAPNPAYHAQLASPHTSMRRLSIQPRSRSIPRSPGPPRLVSPARFDPTGCLREDVLYVDHSYGLRRSFSSPKYGYPGDRRSLSQGMYPPSPSLHSKMLPPFHGIFTDVQPTLKVNEMETSKFLARLSEQNRLLKDQEIIVQQLRMDKDSLEGALVATHQEMELTQGQSLTTEKLQLRKEALQNQLINIRGELSQASSALTTIRMEFEILEEEVNTIHGDLWEQLNAGGQSEVVHRHIQNEFWRVQEVLEGLHKSNSSQGPDTANHRVISGTSGSFSTNSPASPLSSVSLTSPLSPFSPGTGSQVSPPKHLGAELKFGFGKDSLLGERINSDAQDMNKVGIVPPRTKSPTEGSNDNISCRNGSVPNGHISRERPKSAVFPAEVKSRMSLEEQNERIRRNQSSSVRDKRRSLNLSGNQHIDGFRPNYRVIRRRLTAHEVDIKDLEAAVRGEGVESPREEIARLRKLQMESDHYDIDIGKEILVSENVLIPERYLEMEQNPPLSPEEVLEKQKKVERIKTLIAKSNMQNMVPLLDGPAEGPVNPEQQLQEEEKRIELSCALAAEASRRSRLLSAQCIPCTPTSPQSPTPPPR